MQEALVAVNNDAVEVTLHQISVPKPGPGQVLIKTVVSGTNPKDWKMPQFFPDKFANVNSGDDIAGIVEDVGEGVVEFKKGDRVLSFHAAMSPFGSFAEYSIGEASVTAHIPAKISFEEAATVPLTGLMASLVLFARLGLPETWLVGKVGHSRPEGGVVIYGASTAVGAFAVKLLQKADIHPVIAVAGRAKDFVRSLIDESKGDVVIDYREGPDAVRKRIEAAIPKGQKVRHAFNAVMDDKVYALLCEIVDPHGGVLCLVQGQVPANKPAGLQVVLSNVITAHGDDKDFAFVWIRYLARGLADGWLTPHPYEVVPGGLNGVQTALSNLRAGKNSATKYVLRIHA